MTNKTRRRSFRPATEEELFKIQNKGKKKPQGQGKANSLSRAKSSNENPKPQEGLNLEKTRKPTKKELQRQLTGLGPSEDESQMCVIDWCKLQKWKKGNLADYIHHSPNGGNRSMSEARAFKKMGTKAGFPDLFLPIAKEPFSGLFIEMKIATGTVSASQKAYHPLLEDEGYRVEVCYTAEGAINLIKNYLEL